MNYLKFLLLLLIFPALSPVYSQGIQAAWQEREGRFYAFSMREAQMMLNEQRDLTSEISQLGGITRLVGLVFDKNREDLILVGKVDSRFQKIKLDDFVVALRSSFVDKAFPLVSINMTPDTLKTKTQVVYFKGGIEDTRYGSDLLAADVTLKMLGLGYLNPGINDASSYFDLRVHKVKETGVVDKFNTRFWFVPFGRPITSKRDDVVAIAKMEIGVKAEILSLMADVKQVDDLKGITDDAAEEFALALSDNYGFLCKQYPEIAKLRTLFDLAQLSFALKELDQVPDLSFWFDEYVLDEVETLGTYPLVSRSEDLVLNQRLGTLRIYGGIEMKILVLRLSDGDVTAMRRAVLYSRPEDNSLLWEVPIEGWEIPPIHGYYTEGKLTVDEILENPEYAEKEIGCCLVTDFFIDMPI